MMETIWVVVALLCGCVVWYFWYGLECWINGGTIARHPWLFHFPLLWEEFTWILPGGWNRKLEYVDGDAELAATLPGVPHFFFTHLLIPFGPAIFVWYLM